MRGGFEVNIDGSTSSQFISSIMMGAATLSKGIDINITSVASRPYLAITEDVLMAFGARIERRGPNNFTVHGSQLKRDTYEVEGDYSSASYWIAAAAVSGGEVTLAGLKPHSAQGDSRFLHIIEELGATVAWQDDTVTITGPSRLSGGTFDCNDTPDIVPTLAAIAPTAAGPITITNIAHLRVKESDRIAVVASELRKLGAKVEESPDSMTIASGWNDAAATIDPHQDHRIAMSFAIAGLRRGNVSIENEQVVAKSYPRFWRTLDELVESSR